MYPLASIEYRSLSLEVMHHPESDTDPPARDVADQIADDMVLTKGVGPESESLTFAECLKTGHGLCEYSEFLSMSPLYDSSNE